MKRIQFTLFILILTIWNVNAQEDFAPINTGAANFLTLSTDAQSAAMGGVSVALPESNNAIFFNAASSIINPKTAGVSYSFAPVMRDFESGHSLNSLGGFYKIDKRNVILAGFRYYHYPKVEGITDGDNTNKTIRPKEWAIDLGYAREIISNLGVSATVRLIHSDMGNIGGAKSANAVAFDIGAIYKSNFQFMNGASWTAGLQLSNFGTKIKYMNTDEDLPAFIKAGGSVDVSFTPIHRLMVVADLGYRMMPSDIRSLGVSAGAEYTLMDIFKARGGYHYGDKKKGDTSYTTAGLGICHCGAQLDFAWLFAEKESPLKNSFWLTVGYSF